MRPIRTSALLTAAALALSGCATGPGSGPVQVTRFHLDQPIAPGSFTVEPRDRGVLEPIEFEIYADAVGGELGHLGFTRAPDADKSELVAVVGVSRGYRPGPPRGPAFSVGIGGASFGRHSAIGGGVDVPVTRPHGTELVGTELEVRVRRRSDGTVIWEGRARFEARGDSPAGSPQGAAQRLAAALFAGFPGESGRTILVK